MRRTLAATIGVLAFGLVALAVSLPAWADAPASGLVAAYSFDEGSGAVVVDASGNGHAGTLAGATWTTGRYGGGLSFNGSNAYVGLGTLGTFYQSAFTLEAWVQKQTATKNDVGIVGTWAGSGPMLWVDHIATRYQLTLGNNGLSGYLDSGHNPIAGQWQHLAATYDGTTARYYIDGTQVATRTVSGSVGNSNIWRIGAYGTTPGGFFDGIIDDVRIYDRALSAGEVQLDMGQPVSVANAGGPTQPGDPTVTTSTQSSVSVAWAPATDDIGVVGYNLYLDGAPVTTTAATSFTFAELACSTSYVIGIEAVDGAGNVSPRATGRGPTSACDVTTGYRAAYSFDEGSGAVVVDASGNGHAGTLAGATWTTGRYGGGLSFNGSNAYVGLGTLGTFYQSAFTLEAWVQKQTATKNDVGIVGTWAGSGPMLWVDHIATRYQLTLGNNGLSGYLDSGHNPIAGQWQHLAATYDGTTARYYIDGTQVATRTVSGSVGNSNIWRIGAYGTTPGGFFDGIIDDVRIYDRALSAGEVRFDMDSPVTVVTPPVDTTPPTAPGTLTASAGTAQASLSWGPATDNVAVSVYDVHRSTTSGFTPSPANRIAQLAGASYIDSGLAPGTYYYRVLAEDVAGNVGPGSNEASVTLLADTTKPTVSVTAPAAGVTVQSTVTFSANAFDNVAVAGVQFRVDGANVGAEDTIAPYAIIWDSRQHLNGSHALTAVARDTSGNLTTSTSVAVTVTNTGVSTGGLKAAYGLDEASGTVAMDSSDSHLNATTVGSTWVTGHLGNAASFDGANDRIDIPALGTFYKQAFTLEAWVRKQGTSKDVAVVGTWDSSGGPMIWVDWSSGRYKLTLGNGSNTYLDSGRMPTVGTWEHVAATYDGSIARFYVDGSEVASTPYTGVVGNSNSWRIGAYGATPFGFFDGLIDNVRIYDRALSASEVQTDMSLRIQAETTPPTVTAKTPAAGAAGVNVGTSATARFSEPMAAATITTSRFQLKTGAGTVVASTVSYNAATNVATLTPQAALQYGATYTLTVKGGSGGVTDAAGNPLAADLTWSYTTEASPPRTLVVTSSGNPFASYLGEILRNEGLNSFTTIDVSFLSPTLLAQFDVVLLGNVGLTTAQVTTLTNWVTGGGNLVAMRPDKKLASLLGLVSIGSSTLANAYLQVSTGAAPGTGITGSTMQFHGTADRYLLNGATAVATLYSNATTATISPAVSLRSVGSSGGQAAAFTFDLARSVVYTRQGNPAWAGQERDGISGIRPDDMFFGAKAGDVQPDWLDTNKIAIPQADEQQRLLLNLITLIERDKLPLPRFWYLPRGLKAAVVMSGDDHSPGYAPGGTASNFDRFKALSPPGCVVANWECVRATSYILPDSVLTNIEAAAYVADGFEVALHPIVGSCPTTAVTQSELSNVFDTQLAAFGIRYTGVPGPASSRTHCVYWPDWASNAKVELAHGIRMDANYYHYPAAWIGSKPGFLNGGGFPMRFADLDGTTIDVYQQNTNITDESTQAFGPAIDALLDNALGPQGYYGAFGILIHNDNAAPQLGDEAIVASAQARGVPVISYKQMLDWTDGRNNSTIRALTWNAGTLTFTTTLATGANGLQTMLPTQGPTGTLTTITRNNTPVPYTLQTIKGIQYALFDTATATYQATYA